MEIVEFKENDIDIVFEIQKVAYKPLYEKYHDDDTNPYMESKETILQEEGNCHLYETIGYKKLERLKK